MFNATQFYSLFFWLFFLFLYIQHDNNKKKCNRNWVCTNFFLSLSIAMCPGKLLSKFIKSTMGNGSLNGNNSKKKKTNLFLSFRLFYGFYSCYKIACKLQVIISNRPFPCWTYSFFSVELVLLFPSLYAYTKCAVAPSADAIKRINIMLRWRINGVG